MGSLWASEAPESRPKSQKRQSFPCFSFPQSLAVEKEGGGQESEFLRFLGRFRPAWSLLVTKSADARLYIVLVREKPKVVLSNQLSPRHCTRIRNRITLQKQMHP